MGKTEKEEIRKRISEEIERTERDIAQYKEMTNPVAPDIAIGRISRMDAITNKSVMEAALREAEDRLSKLRYMQTRVGDDDLGYCAKCKGPIPIGRLMLMPHSIHCVKCAR
jgi:DnaK suppressor protein